MVYSIVRNKTIIWVAISCLALIFCGTVSEAASWRGTVVDDRTGRPVSGIKVTAGIKGASWYSTNSGDDGRIGVAH